VTVEISPVGMQCNLHCSYCCESLVRKEGCQFDVDTAIEQFEKTGADHFGLHGGEALLTPFPILEKLIETGKCNSIQTNLVLLTDKHIELLKKFKVALGVSIDGPEELNAARCDKEKTALTMKNSWKARDAGIDVSIASVITKVNIADPTRMINWYQDFSKIGIKWYKTHPAQPESRLFVTGAQLLEFWLSLLDAERHMEIRNEFFRDMYLNLQGRVDRGYCCWKGCDPYCTSAVDGIIGDGELYSCERMTKDGHSWIRGNQCNHTIRSRALLLTDCKDCKFFPICQGFCPGTATDWRKKTSHCWAIYQLYDHMRKQLEELYVPTIIDCPQLLMRQTNDSTHGDIPHGNSHGDHTDAKGVK
jgi:uncharacterized protein